MAMTITQTDGPIGAEIRGVRINEPLPDETFQTIASTLYRRGVIVIRDQQLDEADQVAFSARFGTLQQIFLAEHLSLHYPELFLISNILEHGKPIGSMDAGKYWHTDGAYLDKPHNVSLLYALEVPTRNGKALGDTLFAGMAAAYAALPGETREKIDGLRARHSLYHRYTANEKASPEMRERIAKYPPVTHPLVIRHPVTGERCLYVSEGYTTDIEGLGDEHGAELLAQLCEHVVQPAFRYRHRWAVGDVLIWDNRATLHRATFDYQLPERRLMRRATVAGEAIA